LRKLSLGNCAKTWAGLPEPQTIAWRPEMSGQQNVQIPLSLFKKVMFFFNFLNANGHAYPSLCDFDGIISELRAKQHSLNLHNVYSNTIYAKNDEQKNQAFADYKKLKSRL
jgi:hypothetical protein